MFTIQQAFRGRSTLARYRVDVFRERFIVVDLQNDVKDQRQLNEPRSPLRPLFHAIVFAVTLPAFVLRLSRASVSAANGDHQLVNAPPSVAISIAHFGLDRDFKAFVCFRFDGSGVLEVNEKRQAEKHRRKRRGKYGKIASHSRTARRYGMLFLSLFFFLFVRFQNKTGKRIFSIEDF